MSIAADLSHLARLAALLPRDSNERPLVRRLFHEADDEFWFWLNTEGYRRSQDLQRFLPGLPEEDLQIRTIGSSGDAALTEAHRACQLFTGIFEQCVGPIGERTSVLDFGCGWGRILRFFMRRVDQAKLWGLDPSPALIEVCRRTNPWCQFIESRRVPPSPLASGSFDLVYSYSVFSHLSEAAHAAWLIDIRRLLRPGGLFIATTWPRDHIRRSEQLRKTDPTRLSDWHRDLAALWLDNPRWLAAYDAGRFCYQPYPFGTHGWSYRRGESCYGEACIPEVYVRSEWSKSFEVLDYIDDRSRCPQNVIVARQPSHSTGA